MNIKKKHLAKGEVTKKKITFASAVLLVMGSSIGAGIFLKNGEVLTNVGHSVILALVSWILSILGVVCMGISLGEIASYDEKSNLGIVLWVKKFCHKYLFKVAKYFMALIYLPFNFFVMPYYAVMTLQDAFGWQTEWWVAALIAFGITAYLFISAGISSRFANIQNKVVLSVKFIPLAFCAIAGVVLACTGHMYVTSEYVKPITPDIINYPGWLPSNWGMDSSAKSLTQLFPILGIFGSIPAIIFSFDGFYASAGIQSEMEEPRKTPLALVVGLIIVSAIDVLISISLLIGSKEGTISSLNFFFTEDKWHWVIIVMNFLIAIGIFGIINGFAVYNPRFYEDLIKDYQLPFSKKLKAKINPNKPIVGMLYSAVLTLFFFIVLTLVGALGYADPSGHAAATLIDIGGAIKLGYDINPANIGNLNNLYSFCDLMGNWTSILVFLCIVFATIGCMKNRKTNKVRVAQVKGFMPCAIISTCLISLAIVFIVASTFGNIGLVYTRNATFDEKIGAITTLGVLVLFILMCVIPSSIEMHKEKGKPSHYRPWII